MAMITRSITRYKASAYKVVKKDGEFVVDSLGETEFAATAANLTIARQALEKAGIKCPRGTTVDFEEIESVLYAMPADEFIKLAQPIKKIK